jgi:penicillin-binding protein 2
VVDSIEGGDKYEILEQYRKHHDPIDIPDSIFDVVHDGMQGVLEKGTGGNAKVKGITICGKTGTVENYYRGVKQENHSFFCAFAPRENPKIAIMCVVENSGRFGGTYAAPIAGLMIEKYLKDSITDKERLAKIESISKLSLIPKRIYVEVRKQDSLRHSKDSAYLIAKGFIKIIKDTTGIDDGEDEVGLTKLIKDKKDKENKGNKKEEPTKPEAILPGKQRQVVQDSVTKLDN